MDIKAQRFIAIYLISLAEDDFCAAIYVIVDH